MKKYLLFPLLVALLAVQSASGVTVYRHDGEVTTVRGDAVGAALVTVYEANTTTKATLYLDRAAALGTKANPTYSDGYGRYYFYLPLGTYDIVVSGTNITSYTMEDVNIGGVEATVDGIFNVLDYGAVGDGVTDDTAFMQAAIDSCESAGSGEVFWPNKTYRTTATLTAENTSQDDVIQLNFGQAVVVADSGLGGPIIRLGGSAAQHFNINLDGGVFKMSARDWDSTVGVQLNNLYTSRVEDFKVRDCRKGIELSSITTSDGTAYNTISMRHAHNCLFGIYVENDSLGWCNENYFYGDTRISYQTNLNNVDCSGGAGIYAKPVPGATHGMNSLTFNGLSLEFGTSDTTYVKTNGFNEPFAVDVEIQSSNFTGIRTEGWSAIFYASSASKADPCVVKIGTHNVGVGENVYLLGIGGMVELDGRYAVEAITDTTISLTVDSSGFTTYTSGGTVATSEVLNFDSGSLYNHWIGGLLPGGLTYRATPEDQKTRCTFIGLREHALVGGTSSRAVLSVRTASSGYAGVEIFKTNETAPTISLGDDSTIFMQGTVVGSTPDTTGMRGLLWFDKTNGVLRFYNGSGWQALH